MKITKLFTRNSEDAPVSDTTANLITSLLGINTINEAQAMRIPSVSASVGLICDTVSSLKVKLYKAQDDGTIEEVKKDYRLRLLNDDTNDAFDGVSYKRALVRDYLLSGACYSFVNWSAQNKILSLHYLNPDDVSFLYAVDPINHKYTPMICGTQYMAYEVMIIPRATTNGYEGKNTVVENSSIFSAGYNTVLLQDSISKSGGAKAGFLTSERTLSKEAMTQLKSDFSNMYGNQNERKVIVLNNGMHFEEASSTSAELQMNENKKTNNLEITSVFRVPYDVLYGDADDDTYDQFLKNCIEPILTSFECAFNKYLLLEDEKSSFYFAFDTSKLFKGSMLNRFSAYATAIDKGIMQIDEVRVKENLNPLGMDLIKLGLSDVLYNPKTKEVFNANSGKMTDLENPNNASLEGGEQDESGS